MKRCTPGVLRSIQKRPELVKSFSRQPECFYILGMTLLIEKLVTDLFRVTDPYLPFKK